MDKATKKLLPLIIPMICVVIVSVLFIVGAANFYKTGIINGYHHVDWFSAYGSFVGGLTTPIFSLFTLIMVLVSHFCQRVDAGKASEEREENKKVIDAQLDSVKQQQFESTFFSLLDIHNNLLSKITEIDKDNLSLAEQKICCVLEFPMDYDAPDEFDQRYSYYAKYRKVADGIKSIKFLDDPHLKLYLMGLLQLLIFIDRAEETSQQSYCDIVKSMVPNEVLHIVMFSCFFYQQETDIDRKTSWTKYGSLFSYVEKYFFLEHIRFSYSTRDSMMMSLVTSYFYPNDKPNTLPSVHALRVFNVFENAFGSNCRQIDIFINTCCLVDFSEIKTLIVPFNEDSYLGRYFKK